MDEVRRAELRELLLAVTSVENTTAQRKAAEADLVRWVEGQVEVRAFHAMTGALSEMQILSIVRLAETYPHGWHEANLTVRKDAVERHYEADWAWRVARAFKALRDAGLIPSERSQG